MAAQMERARQRNEVFWLALSPEGTRRYTDGWRSGFYQVALRARVPVLVVQLDVRNKRIDLSRFVTLTGQIDADHQRLAAHCAQANGFKMQGASPVRPLSTHPTCSHKERP
jgi:hypothetical protein